MKAAELFVKCLENEGVEFLFGVPGEENVDIMDARFGRPSHVAFQNPDFVKYAESFGAKGYRVERANDLAHILKQALADDTMVLIDCPVDYAENMKLTKKLKELISPV